MGGDLVAYTIKKAIVDVTDDVPLTLNLFWLLTFPLVALAAVPALRALRASPSTAVVGGVLFALAPYHFRNGTGHSNLAFYVGVPVIVIACVRMLGPPGSMPTLAALRTRAGWRSIRWLVLGAVLVAVTGIYYLAFLLTLVATCALIGARRAPPTGPARDRRGHRRRRARDVGAREPPDDPVPLAARGEHPRRPRPSARR